MAARFATAAARGHALRRDLDRHLGGAIDLADDALERRLYGADNPVPDEPLSSMLRRLGQHKFDEDPPDYRVVRACLQLLPRRDMTLLDVGCGRGRVLLCAALSGARHATGLEIVEYRAAMARRAAARLAPDAVTVVQGNALKLPWPKAGALIVMNPFYPTAHRRLRARLLDYARAHRPVIVTVSTLRDRLRTDRRFRLRAEIAVEWITLAAFELRD
ncbi:MAG TPA: class I SAM-dependent methyltransferase [Rhizomicrobium sp.]